MNPKIFEAQQAALNVQCNFQIAFIKVKECFKFGKCHR